MIDFDSWPVLVKLALLLFPFFPGFLSLAINVQIATSRDFTVALSAIKSNPYLEKMKSVWGDGSLRSRYLLLATVSALVTFPKWYLYMGWVDEVEIKNFPLYLRRKMVVALWLNFISMLWALVIYLII
ncbi:hypothetical protein C6A77_14280 [Pseudomonas sp. AFG_SD02_1510_Pfu_092]|uniref:hypothetical protein n=1 Tax=Pseudomonas sp. AFG_SD02_1510_Pfu_092 TaxID=2259497 RepID=UPI000DEEE8BC|nr:hypothetical protein [Pseudomonas sp. AFG_SD02_1510_Pfu_092]RCL25185.1 hypothetical protein C6A77_14280 [Pseudomonas sp. AFG_SD02_1510_Pfu_092]